MHGNESESTGKKNTTFQVFNALQSPLETLKKKLRTFFPLHFAQEKIYIQKTASKMQKKGEKEDEDRKNIWDKNNHERRINEKRLKLLF